MFICKILHIFICVFVKFKNPKNKDNNKQELKLNFTYDEEKCTKCKMCERVCAYQARKLNDKMELNEEECRYCGLCISVCKPKALGRKISCSELNV